MADKFEKFTERARKVFSLAQEEAQQMNHNYIGTEHLLLGLVREGDGIAARVLARLGVQLPKVRQEVLNIIGEGKDEVTGDPGLTPRAKKVIELSMDEARRLNNHYIGTEHLLLGLVREGEGVAMIALEKLGVSKERIHEQVLQIVSRSQSYQQSPQIRKPSEPVTGPAMSMDELTQRFTERARKVFELTHEEAARFNHNYIGTEHLLLGLVKEGDGIAARVLANLGVQLPKVRSAVEFIIGRGDGLIVGQPGLTPRAKKVIELSMDEARRLNNHYIGTEHLLLGLVREGEGIAAGVLESLGVSLEKVRQQVMQVVSQSSSYQQSTSSDIALRVSIPAADYLRLRGIAKRSDRSVDELVQEAIHRVWFTEDGDAEIPPPPSPPPASGGGEIDP